MITDDDLLHACRWALAKLLSNRSVYDIIKDDDGWSDERYIISEIGTLAEANATPEDKDAAMLILQKLGKAPR